MHQGNSRQDDHRQRGHPSLEEDPYEVLELKPGAGPTEIEEAYHRLMAIFDPSAPGISALYTLEEIRRMRAKIERAYHHLLAQAKGSKGDALPLNPNKGTLPPEEVEDIKARLGRLGGRALREIRERLGLSLQEVASVIKVTKGTLENIEAERFDRLPAWVYVKGFLRAYAKFLGVDPQEVTKAFEEVRRQ